jgi:hypothetical protein
MHVRLGSKPEPCHVMRTTHTVALACSWPDAGHFLQCWLLLRPILQGTAATSGCSIMQACSAC